MNKILKNKKLIIILSITTLIVTVVTILLVAVLNKSKDKIKYVMHASGGFEDKIYLNSIESFEHNLEQGNTLFEVDFIYTKDGHIVCSHEFENIGNYSLSNKPTYTQFNQSLIYGKYHALTIDYIVEKVKENPKIKIIFDSKAGNKIKIMLSIGR